MNQMQAGMMPEALNHCPPTAGWQGLRGCPHTPAPPARRTLLHVHAARQVEVAAQHVAVAVLLRNPLPRPLRVAGREGAQRLQRRGATASRSLRAGHSSGHAAQGKAVAELGTAWAHLSVRVHGAARLVAHLQGRGGARWVGCKGCGGSTKLKGTGVEALSLGHTQHAVQHSWASQPAAGLNHTPCVDPAPAPPPHPVQGVEHGHVGGQRLLGDHVAHL